MRIIFTLSLSLFALGLVAQQATIKGQLQDATGEAVAFANVALYSVADSSLVKVAGSEESGVFEMQGIKPGDYSLEATFVGLPDLKRNIQLQAEQNLDLGALVFDPAATNLEEVTVKATRAMVEIKPDRTVFNVQGTINSTGEDALALLRKAPGVMVDNNDNVTVLGRSGVLLYVDGKRLPLTGDDLSAYLQSLTAEQIDRIDIISNPGARYEAEGNAGIIDIRLKRDKNLGANGSLTGSYSQGRYARYNLNGSSNYRNKKFNAFVSAGLGERTNFNDMIFESIQNDIRLSEQDNGINKGNNYNLRLGMDFFMGKNHTLGFLASNRVMKGTNDSENRLRLSPAIRPIQVVQPEAIDSILFADNFAETARNQNTFNLNYRFDNTKGRSINIDADYGSYGSEINRYQPNIYYDGFGETKLSERIDSFETPTDIKIYTFKLDYEEEVLGGKLGLGTKLSRVESDNTFDVFNLNNGLYSKDLNNSNVFDYDENVYAAYANFARPINEKWNFTAGLRAEQTDATGILTPADPTKQEPPVELNYLSLFPSAGLTWQVARQHALALNYGRRINRPDYNVLNPFRNQLSELSYEKGNPTLNPEIVNNLELGYTFAYRYNFKLAVSRTIDQITRLIGPDDVDLRASFISWNNLGRQDVASFSISAPTQLTKKWSAYFNVGLSYLDNQADYGEGAVVDLQAFTYSIYQQHTFTLPAGLKGEISGYYAGPGIWGGVFRYESSWSLNLGLQRKFLQERLNVRLSGSDLFYESGWDGISMFDGLVSAGRGRNDTRRISLSVSYNFGNENVKSRKRKTGIEEEADRVGN